ncbi:MAG: rRNA maturation RNase YbeY [Planctomycetes bacterium]|nr:rRNA maturation RNase YbeY [Planctomycetota bacterium]
MAKIEITDLQDHIQLDKKLLLQVVRHVMKEEGRCAKSLSVVLTDNRHIRDLSNDYLGRDTITDVISFPLEDPEWPEALNHNNNNGSINGEIIASAERAYHQAQAIHGNPEAELLLYIVHGLLHLIGYDDRTPQDAQRMHAREDALLQQLGFPCVYAGQPSVH